MNSRFVDYPFDTEIRTYGFETEANNSRVVKALRRAYKKAYYLVEGDFSEKLCYTRAVQGDGELHVEAVGGHNFYRELYAWQAGLRETDDYIDEELYMETPIQPEKIKSAINSFAESYPDFEVGAEMLHDELQLRVNNVDDRRERIERVVHKSAADFHHLVRRVIDEYGSTLSTADREQSLAYYEQLQPYLQARDDVMKLREDRYADDYNSIKNTVDNDIPVDFYRNMLDRLFERMREKLDGVNDDDHRRFLKRNTDYWARERELSVDPILDALEAGHDSGALQFVVKQK